MNAHPLLSVEQARKRFGGLVAVNDVELRGQAGRTGRIDRAERLRQDDDAEPDIRRAAAYRRAHPA